MIKTTKLIGSLNKWPNGVQESSCAACLDEQTILAHKQATLAQNVRVQVSRSGRAQYLAIDQVENVVQALARYVSQVIIDRALSIRLGEPNL